MQKKILSKRFWVIASILLATGVFLVGLLNWQFEGARAGSGDSVSGFAWIGIDDNPAIPGDTPIIGWLSFNSTNCDSDGDGATDQGNFVNCPIGGLITDYGVNIDAAGLFSGYAWNGEFSGILGKPSGIGWISFADFDKDGDVDAADRNILGSPCAPNCEARLDFVTDEVSGWARALSAVAEPEAGGWDGWLKLRGAAKDSEEYGVYYDDSDPANARLMGWAWGGDDDGDKVASIGWVSFSARNIGPGPIPDGDEVCSLALCREIWPATESASCDTGCSAGWTFLGLRVASNCGPGENCVCCYNDTGPPPPPPLGACDTDYCQELWLEAQYANCKSSLTCDPDQIYLGSRPDSCVGGEQCVCCRDDWSPIVENPNSPPDPPDELNETFFPCSWEGAVSKVALGLKIRLDWNYFDPEGDAQLAYEIEIDDDSGFPAGKKRFNHIVEPSPCDGITGGPTCSYNLNLCDDDDDALCSDWLSELSWSKKYFWRVRAKDVASEQWSDWSDVGPLSPGEFVTPQHALPKPNFETQPVLPSVNEIIQVCARQMDGACGILQPSVCSTDLSKCYNPANVPIDCCNPNPGGWTYEWTINAPEGQFVNDSVWRKYNPFPIIQIDTQQSTSTNPQMRFDSAGLYANGLELKITDDLGSCSKAKNIRISIPLPKWKEVSP